MQSSAQPAFTPTLNNLHIVPLLSTVAMYSYIVRGQKPDMLAKERTLTNETQLTVVLLESWKTSLTHCYCY